jgi:hypothetical protein
VPAFNEFDKDGSGAIDREELNSLSTKLGTPLSEDQLTAALRDLDLNGDGVVDLDEFKRWYFTGMKPYNGARRTMLKVGGKARALLATVHEETKALLMSQELKYKHSSISVGFNAPKNPQTVIATRLDFGGQHGVKMANELREQYQNTTNAVEEK